jgi:hypothetical protein
LDANVFEADGYNEEGDAHEVALVLDESHKVAGWAELWLGKGVASGAVEVGILRLRLALVYSRLNRINNIMIQYRLKIIFILVANNGLKLAAQCSLVACNPSIDVVILVLVVVWISIWMKPLPICVEYFEIF